MTDKRKPSFAKSLRSLVTSSSSSHSRQQQQQQQHHDESTPKSKRRLRGGGLGGSFNNSSRGFATSELEDIMEPSAKAQQLSQKQQQQKQRHHQQHQQSQSSKASTKGNSKSPASPKSPKAARPARASAAVDNSNRLQLDSKTPMPPPSTGAEMRQRLKEIQDMIDKGKDLMEKMQFDQVVKIQGLARGYLLRKSISKKQQSPKNRHLRKSTASSGSDNNYNNGTAPTSPQRNTSGGKKRRKKVKKTNSGGRDKEGSVTAGHSRDREKEKWSHRRSTTSTATNNSDPKNNNNIAAIQDHYAWNSKGSKSEHDHYTWAAEGQDLLDTPSRHHRRRKELDTSSSRHQRGQSLDDTQPSQNQHRSHNHDSSGSTRQHHRSHSEPAAACGNTKNSKKTRRLSGIKNKDHISKKDANATTDSVTKSHSNEASAVDDSEKLLMKDVSMSFSELERQVRLQAESSGSMTASSLTDPAAAAQQDSRERKYQFQLPTIPSDSKSSAMDAGSSVLAVAAAAGQPLSDTDGPEAAAAVFEDSSKSNDDHGDVDSHNQRSLRSASLVSVENSSALSKLTEDMSQASSSAFGGSLTSRDDSFMLGGGGSFYLEGLDEEDTTQEEEDLLSPSVMATAPARKAEQTLTGDDLKYFGQQDQRQQFQQDDAALSVSVMAVSPRRVDDDDEEGRESDFEDSEGFSYDSQSSYAYGYEDKQRRRGSRKLRTDDDLSMSVMAVAGVSDWDDEESGLELETDTDMMDDISDYDDYLSDSVMAVAPDHESDYDGETETDYHEEEEYNLREDEMSITTCETDLPRESFRRRETRQERRRRRNPEDNIVEAEDVSVLTTASNKRHKRQHHSSNNNSHRIRTKSRSDRKLGSDGRQLLPPPYASDASDSSDLDNEDLRKERRHHRRSRKSTAKKRRNSQHKTSYDSEKERKLQQRLDDVNKEIFKIKDTAATLIQSFVRMHQQRLTLEGRMKLTEVRTALSRQATKPIKAAIRIQCLVRRHQSKAMLHSLRRAPQKGAKKKRTGNKPRNQQDEVHIAKQKAKLQQRLEEVEFEMQACQEAVKTEKAIQLQAVARGSMVRSKDLLNIERLASIRIQRMVKASLRVSKLRKQLVAISDSKDKELKSIVDKKKASIDNFEPGKYDDMDTRVKMVNFLKKQIEKENDAGEKLVAKIKAIKESNTKLMTTNSTRICNLTRLEHDVEGLQEHHDALAKVTKEWIDGIKEYEGRIQALENGLNLQQRQQKSVAKYMDIIVNLVASRSTNKKLIKELKFLSKHTNVAAVGEIVDDPLLMDFSAKLP